MWGNSLENAAAIFIMFMAALVFFFGVGVLENFNTTFDEFVNSSSLFNGTNLTVYYDVRTETNNLIDVVIDGFNFGLMLLILFTYYSSFIRSVNFQEYVLSFVLGIIISSILLFFATSFFNLFVEKAAPWTNIESFPLWFLENISTILLLNLIAGGLSFIFSRREGR